MPLSIRPLAVSLTVALIGAVGMVVAAPAAARGPQAGPPQRQSAPPPRQQPRVPAAQFDQRRPRQRASDEATLSDSIRRVERRTGGQVLSAESMPYEGRSVSRIKVIDETGRVRVIVDDPQAAGGDPRTRRDDD